MAWNATLYTNFRKRVNSTEQPTGGTTYACRLKHDTDFKRPTIEVQAADLSDVCYMQLNGQYFYVTSVVSHRTGIWEITGSRDPMATFKTDIGRTRSLILYNETDTNAQTIERVPDARIPISRNPSMSVNSTAITGNFEVSPAVGSFLLSAVGEYNGVTTYLVSHSSMMALLGGLSADILDRMSSWFAIGTYPTDIIEAVRNLSNGAYYALSQELAFGNYADSIKACYWIPFTGLDYGTKKDIWLGNYDTNIRATVPSSRVVSQVFYLDIPWPEGVDDGKRNNCLIQLYLPFCGTVVIPTDKAINSSRIGIEMSLDLIGGSLAYRVSVGAETLVVTGANVAAPYAIGSSNITLQQVMQGVSQVVGGGVEAAAGAMAGPAGAGFMVGGISSMASGIAQVITPMVQTVGSMGGLAAAGLHMNLRVVVIYYPPINEITFQSAFGHPVMRVGIVGSGYNQCKGFSVSCPGTPEEIEQINSYFNTGAYYE